MEKKYNLIAYLLLIGTVIIWGSSWPLGRWIVTGDDTIPPLVIVILRYGLVVIFFPLILFWKEKTLHFSTVKDHWKLLTLMGILTVTIYQSGYLFGESFTSASDASLVVASGPIWVLLIASILTDETLTRQKLLGTFIAFFGVFIIVVYSPNEDVENRLLGDLLILIAAFAYAFYTVLIRFFFNLFEAEEKPSSLFVSTWVAIFGFFFTIPISLISSPEYLSIQPFLEIPIRIWYGILYLAFLSTIFAYLAFVEGVNRLGASQAAIFINFVPVVGVALSAIFLHEIIDPVIHFLSFIFIVIGVTLVNRQNSKSEVIQH
ncbi:MAG: DMT family transporter [Candidatus Hodarchaeales archaeon]|jgi:drug/metabolite transporter (DMT)-like permease